MKRKRTSKFYLILISAGLIFCALFIKNWALSQLFVSAVHTLTGFNAQVQSVRLDPLNGIVHIKGLYLFDPPGFKERVFGEAPEIYLDLDLPALLKKEKVHFRELRLNINRLNVEKNDEGVSNVSLLNPVKNTNGKEQREEREAAVSSHKMAFQLDRFELTLGRISYYDHSGLVPKKIAVNLHGQKKIFEDIGDAKSIVNIIVLEALEATPIGNLGINAKELQNQLLSNVGTVREFGTQVFKLTGTELVEGGQVLGKIVVTGGKEKLGQVTGTTKQVTDTTKEEIVGLWGKFRQKANEVKR